MNNAVLFFDECEAVFGRRGGGGGDKTLNTLLTEIERHEGIVFLATNRPYTLDEAMHRRITAVVEYRPPDFNMRYRIWENLLKSGKLELGAEVDIAALAAKYELTGGFIKNAVMSALLSALNRDKVNPKILQDDLILGCKLQMRGSLTKQSNFESRFVPNVALKDLELTQNQTDSTNSILRFEKTRAKVYGTWFTRETTEGCSGSETDFQRANINLFIGPGGAGKKTLMNAIAAELERPVKVIAMSDLHGGDLSSSMTLLSSLMQDAVLADMLVAIDGFEFVIESAASQFLARVMTIIYRFPGCVVLLCNVDSPDVVRLRRDFAAKIFSVVKFLVPPSEIRGNLWRKLLPPRAPLHSDINFMDLGRRYELYPGGIRAAIAKACSEVAARDSLSSSKICHKDLQLAGEGELEKLRGGRYELELFC